MSSDGSGSVCVDCSRTELLKEDECVSDCGSGHYPEGGRCTGMDV